MNRKQFLILVVALLVLGGAGLALFWQDISAYQSAGAKIGAKLLPNVRIADVAQIRLQDADSTATLTRNDKSWVVKERSDYPASVQDISDFLIKAIELKVVQSETVGESLYPRLGLAAQGKGAEKGAIGTLIELKSADGKVLATLTLGKTVLKKDPGNPLPNAQDGVPAGRYVLVGGSKDVVVVSDPLEKVKADPARWLARTFFKVDRIKTLAVSGNDGYKISRDLEYGPWKFAAGGGDLDPSAAVQAVNALSNMTFTDVVSGPAPETEAPVTITAETYDKLTYTLKLAKRKGGSDYLLNVSLAGEPPAAREEEKGEKPEEKEKRDKEFEAQRKRLMDRIELEKILTRVTFVVADKELDKVLRPRAELVRKR